MAFLMDGDRWRPVKKDKMTDRQWKNLVNSGGNVDENGKVWYPKKGHESIRSHVWPGESTG